jgi:voltage-gated potassium channel
VGYGDISPITPGGRVVAIILIFSGMAAIGSMIAAIETYVIKAQKLSK